MKVSLSVGVYDGDDLVDTVSFVLPVEPWAYSLAKIPEDSVDVSVKIESLEVLYE